MIMICKMDTNKTTKWLRPSCVNLSKEENARNHQHHLHRSGLYFQFWMGPYNFFHYAKHSPRVPLCWFPNLICWWRTLRLTKEAGFSTNSAMSALARSALRVSLALSSFWLRLSFSYRVTDWSSELLYIRLSSLSGCSPLAFIDKISSRLALSMSLSKCSPMELSWKSFLGPLA